MFNPSLAAESRLQKYHWALGGAIFQYNPVTHKNDVISHTLLGTQ
jgi:hypothetical protein